MGTRTADQVARAAGGSTDIVIETALLRIRSYRDDDLADLVALAGNWEVARWVGTIPHPYTESDGREWIARAQENHATGQPRRFAIAPKETDRRIGGVGLDGTTGDGSEEPALGYWLGQPYWGNGYAREAAAAVIDYGFQTPGLETLRAYTDPGNAGSQKVLLYCGRQNVDEIELLKPTHHGRPASALIPHLSARAFSMSTVITGGCLCGNIRFAYRGILGTAAYCHCSDCRKCTGGPFSVSVAMEIEHLEIATGSSKGFTKQGDSGNELTRHFCPDCGSPLFTSSPRHPDLVYVKAGAFDDPTLVQPVHQSWTRSSVPWAAIRAGLRSYETGRG